MLRTAALRCSVGSPLFELAPGLGALRSSAPSFLSQNTEDEPSCSDSSRHTEVNKSHRHARLGRLPGVAGGVWNTQPAPHGLRFASTSAATAAGWGLGGWWKRKKQEPQPDQSAETSISEAGSQQVAPIVEDQAPAVPEVDPSFFPLPEDSLEVIGAINQACEAIERASLMAAKADAFFSASWFISAFQYAHESGLPWWGAVAAVNIAARCVTFPLMVVSQKATASMVKFNHALLHAKNLQQAASRASSPEEQQRLFKAFQQEYQARMAEAGNPTKTAMLIPGVLFVNFAVFISLFNGVSKLMDCKAPSLTTGGMLWFNDLTISDPYYGLPILCAGATLAMLEYGMASGGAGMEGAGPAPGGVQPQGIKWFLRAMSLMFLPAGSYVSSGVAVLWVSNSAFAVVQGLLMKNDAVRTKMGLPTMAQLKSMNAQVSTANSAGAPASAGAPPPGSPPLASAVLSPKAGDKVAAGAQQMLTADQLFTKPPKRGRK